MTLLGVSQIVIFFLIVLALTKPVGAFMYRVFEGQRTFLHPVLAPVERVLYRASGVDPQREMRWSEYTIAMLGFSFVGMLL